MSGFSYRVSFNAYLHDELLFFIYAYDYWYCVSKYYTSILFVHIAVLIL